MTMQLGVLVKSNGTERVTERKSTTFRLKSTIGPRRPDRASHRIHRRGCVQMDRRGRWRYVSRIPVGPRNPLAGGV